MDALVPIRAAGGVVWREGRAGAREVVLVHRPRHDDWTLPKGKLKPGEPSLVAAVREVWEETAIRAFVGARLPTVQYDVWSKGSATRPPAMVEKLVDYWTMRVSADDGFAAGHETDARAWLDLDEALGRLSYPHDVRVLTAFSELPPVRDPVVLLRHSSAGDQKHYAGPDARRPLDADGIVRAEELVAALRCFAPARLVSATPRRCVDTLRPLARLLGLRVKRDPAFDDEAEPKIAADRLRYLSEAGGPVVVCSQGHLIPAALGALSGHEPQRYRTAKGDGWVLSFADKGLAALDELLIS